MRGFIDNSDEDCQPQHALKIGIQIDCWHNITGQNHVIRIDNWHNIKGQIKHRILRTEQTITSMGISWVGTVVHTCVLVILHIYSHHPRLQVHYSATMPLTKKVVEAEEQEAVGEAESRRARWRDPRTRCDWVGLRPGAPLPTSR